MLTLHPDHLRSIADAIHAERVAQADKRRRR